MVPLHIQNKMFRWLSRVAIVSVTLLLSFSGEILAQDGHVPVPGLHAYTRGHAKFQQPADLLGGPLKVKVTQKNGSTRWVLPGPRFLDPSAFGTPEKPVGFDPAPFPLLGIPTAMRKTSGDSYTFVEKATPFSDWREVGVGSIEMEVV
ncbi:hypothetical protein D6833_06095, partial [Candidatus Parcubacteria bacterium]